MNERIEKLLENIRVNEQIERLAKEAGCSIDRLGFGEGHLEKFAELIVKECMNKTAGYLLEDEFGGSDVKEASEELAKHFGVEE